MRTTVYTTVSIPVHRALLEIAKSHRVSISAYIHGIVVDALHDEGATISDDTGFRPRGKLTPQDIIEIKDLLAWGGMTLAAVGRDYGITAAYVHKLKKEPPLGVQCSRAQGRSTVGEGLEARGDAAS